MKTLSKLLAALLLLAACGETEAAAPTPATTPTVVPWATLVAGEQQQETALVKSVTGSDFVRVTYDLNTDTLRVDDIMPNDATWSSAVLRAYHLLRAIYGPEQKRVPFATTLNLSEPAGVLLLGTLDEATQIPWDWAIITPDQVVAGMSIVMAASH